MEFNSERHLILRVPRGKYRIYSFILLLIAASFAYEATNSSIDQNFHVIAMIVCSLFAVKLLWQSFFSQPLIFDTDKKCVFRGRHLITRFSDIEYIELRKEKKSRYSTDYHHWVRLCLKRSRKFTLGYQDANVAFVIAEVVEKPVRAGTPFSL
jgi:hypothetical protein